MQRVVLGLVILVAGCDADNALTVRAQRDAGSDFSRGKDLFGSSEDLVVSGDLAEPPDPCGFSPPWPACNQAEYGPNTPQPFPYRAAGERHDHLRLDPDSFLVLDGGISGDYHLLVPGCLDHGTGEAIPTPWMGVSWDADLPPGAGLTVRARAANTADLNNPAWSSAMATPARDHAPLNLQGVLSPNVLLDERCAFQDVQDGYLLVDVHFSAADPNAGPRLRSVHVTFVCDHCGG